MHVFVTVGSTRFDTLVQRALSEPVIDILRAKGYSKIVVQCGNSDFDSGAFERTGDTWIRRGNGEVEVWRFKPSLHEEYEQADLVISHAGQHLLIFNTFPHHVLNTTNDRFRNYTGRVEVEEAANSNTK